MKRILAAAASAAFLAGCGGGGGSIVPHGVTSGAPAGGGTPISGDSRATASLTANAVIAANKVPQLYRRQSTGATRSTFDAVRHTRSIATVEVDGTLYQGAVSAIPITNKQNVTPASDGTITVSETFSNVVPTNNDWVTFEFFAVANDGSKYDLGSLATFVNVGNSATNATNLSAQSTEVFQVAQALFATGNLSTYDIEQNANLASDLATKLAATGITANATTQLLDPASVLAAAAAIGPQYRRDLTISVPAGTGSGADQFSIAYDSAQPDENDLFYNVQQLVQNMAFVANAQPFINGPASVAGAPFAGGNGQTAVPFHSPSSGALHATPLSVGAVIINPKASTLTIHNVYGGHLVVGAYDNGNSISSDAKARHTASTRSPKSVSGPSPSLAGTTAVAPAAPGASSVSVTLADTNTTVQIADTQAAAFAGTPAGGYTSAAFAFELAPSATQSGVVPTYYAWCDSTVYPYGCYQGLPGNTSGHPGPSGPSSGTAYNAATWYDLNTGSTTFSTWNAFGVTPSQLRICSLATCSPLAPNVPAQAAFYDPGWKLSAYGWAGVDAGTTVAQSTSSGVPNGYTVTYTIPAGQDGSGKNVNPITVAITASTTNVKPFILFPATILVNMRNQPATMTFVPSVVDTSGTTYAGNINGSNCYNYPWASACQGPVTGGPANVWADQLSSVTLTFTIPADSVAASASAATTGSFLIGNIGANINF